MSNDSKSTAIKERPEDGPFISSTMTPTIMGLNSFKSPYMLYRECMGIDEKPDLSDNAAVQWGIKLEDLVCQEYAERTKQKVYRVNKCLAHPDYPWMISYIDRRIVGVHWGLEAKTAGPWMTKEWGPSESDDFPAAYHVQNAHNMAITAFDGFDLAVLIGGRDFRMYHDPRNDELVEAAIDFGFDFRQRLINEEPPPPETENDLKLAYPWAIQDALEVSARWVDELAKLRRVKDEMKALKEVQKELEIELKKRIGDYDAITHEDTVLAKWSNRERKSYTVKASKFRVLLTP